MPKKVDHKLRREEFLAAAYRTIKKKGIGGATVRAIAKEAGFTTGALVHYVDSIDDLLVQASEYAARDVRARMEEAENLPDKLEALRQVLYLALCTDEDKRGNWNFFLGFWERSVHNAAVRRVTHARYAEWLKRTGRLMRNAQRAGDIPGDVDDSAPGIRARERAAHARRRDTAQAGERPGVAEAVGRRREREVARIRSRKTGLQLQVEGAARERARMG